MVKFSKLIREINFTLDYFLLFITILNTSLIFLFCFLILILVNLKGYYAAIPALIYFIVEIYYSLNRNKSWMIEKNYLEVNEKLRTAVDNRKIENPVVEELQHDVISDMKKAPVSKFFGYKSSFGKIFFILLLCFAILIVSVLNFKLFDFNTTIKDIGFNMMIADDASGEGEGDTVIAGMKANEEDIFGEQSLAILGDEELTLDIKPISYEINVRKIRDVEEQDFQDTFPDEVCIEDCSSSETFEDDVPLEQQELVKNYFKNIAKS